MQHSMKPEQLGPRGDTMSHAVQTCVHCGFCLPTCPTYQVLGHEPDSPRGRIILMKEVLEGKLSPAQAQTHIDRCLGCVACQTACPSGVPYGELISSYRDWLRETGQQPRSIPRWIAGIVLPFPARFRFAMKMGSIVRNRQWLVPPMLRPMVALVPESLPKSVTLPEFTPAIGKRRGRVALLAGCAQQVLAPDINLATLRVLARQGIEVVVPQSQGCCGALAWHIGDGPTAQKFARKNLKAFPSDVDAILTNAAGCGSGLHEYPLILKGADEEEAAAAFAHKVQDVSQYLDQLGLIDPPKLGRVTRVAYHDACHLAHAQKVTTAPRRLLASIGNLILCELQDSEICCGSAGTYNLDQPAIAAELGQKKARSILHTNCEMVATGNIGCMVQIETALKKAGHPMSVMHTMQVIDRAYRNA